MTVPSLRADNPQTEGAATSWGVVLLGHGSQRGASRAECSCAWQGEGMPAWCLECPNTPTGLNEALNLLGDELGLNPSQIILSCLEFIEPNPDQAVRILQDRGLRRVVVMPFLLGNGKHATVEMAEVLDDIRSEMPQVQLFLSEGLGTDTKIADLVVQRVRSLGNPARGKAEKAGPNGILLIKAGTKTQYDDCVWLEELGQMVERKLGSEYVVAVAQSHYGDPTMEAGAAKLVNERGASSITCVPYLFFPGMILQRNIVGSMKELEETYPGVPLAVTPPLCVDRRLVAVAADRVREVWDREDSGDSEHQSRP